MFWTDREIGRKVDRWRRGGKEEKEWGWKRGGRSGWEERSLHELITLFLLIHPYIPLLSYTIHFSSFLSSVNFFLSWNFFIYLILSYPFIFNIRFLLCDVLLVTARLFFETIYITFILTRFFSFRCNSDKTCMYCVGTVLSPSTFINEKDEGDREEGTILMSSFFLPFSSSLLFFFLHLLSSPFHLLYFTLFSCFMCRISLNDFSCVTYVHLLWKFFYGYLTFFFFLFIFPLSINSNSKFIVINNNNNIISS